MKKEPEEEHDPRRSETAVLHHVKILGLVSTNGREYLPEAVERARSLYEGAKVNVNHPHDGPQAPRDYQDRIGNIQNVEYRPGEGLYADFHFNPCHPLAEQLIWDASHAPRNVGFSHNIQARTTPKKDGTLLVTEILAVRSVDLVADPATTAGLFEQQHAHCSVPLQETVQTEIREVRGELAALRARFEELAQATVPPVAPSSREQTSHWQERPMNTTDFVRCITGRASALR